LLTRKSETTPRDALFQCAIPGHPEPRDASNEKRYHGGHGNERRARISLYKEGAVTSGGMFCLRELRGRAFNLAEESATAEDTKTNREHGLVFYKKAP
jgi:hypothetical protein